MSQKSSVPQAVSFVSQVLKRDTICMLKIAAISMPRLHSFQEGYSAQLAITPLLENASPASSSLEAPPFQDRASTTSADLVSTIGQQGLLPLLGRA